MKQIQATKLGHLLDKDLEKRGKVECLDVPEPQIVSKTDVKIKVAYCAICGSDPHVIEGQGNRPVPFGIGHELSGVIVELGEEADITGLKVGDRVAGNFSMTCGTCYYCRAGLQQYCRSPRRRNAPGMSEYVIWHEMQVFKLPDDVSLRKGCLLEPVAISTRVTDRAGIKVGDRVCVQGGGPIGLLILQMMKMRAATKLTLIEPIAERREIAKRFGAEFVIDPISQDVREVCKEITGGMGYDCVVEASGFGPAASIPIDIASSAGTLMYISRFDSDYRLPVPLTDVFHNRELTFTATRVAPYTYPRAAQIFPYMDLDPFLQKSFYIDDGAAAFDSHMKGEFPKILINCNADLADL